MMALLSPRLWAALFMAVALAASHWKAYIMGGNAVQAKWDAQKLELTQAALAADQEARASEQDKQAKLAKVSNDYQTEKKRRLAADLLTADSLRNLQAAIDSKTGSDTATASGTDGAGGLESELLGNCAGSLAGLAKEADRLESKVGALQDYARQVCVSQNK